MVSQFDMQVFQWQNQMRTYPQSFIPELQQRLTRFNGKDFDVYGNGTQMLSTTEGPKAV